MTTDLLPALDDDLDDVHVWLHQIALHYRGRVDRAEAARRGRDRRWKATGRTVA